MIVRRKVSISKKVGHNRVGWGFTPMETFCLRIMRVLPDAISIFMDNNASGSEKASWISPRSELEIFHGASRLQDHSHRGTKLPRDGRPKETKQSRRSIGILSSCKNEIVSWAQCRCSDRGYLLAGLLGFPTPSNSVFILAGSRRTLISQRLKSRISRGRMKSDLQDSTQIRTPINL